MAANSKVQKAEMEILILGDDEAVVAHTLGLHGLYRIRKFNSRAGVGKPKCRAQR